MAIATLFCKTSETSERSAVRIFLNIQRSYGWTGVRRGWGDMGADEGRRRESMTAIPDTLSPFVRFIQLKSLRDRTKEEYVR